MGSTRSGGSGSKDDSETVIIRENEKRSHSVEMNDLIEAPKMIDTDSINWKYMVLYSTDNQFSFFPTVFVTISNIHAFFDELAFLIRSPRNTEKGFIS